MNYQQKIESLLSKLPHRYSVSFAVYCCNDVKHLMSKEGLLALELTEKWLANNDSVTADELIAVASATYTAAHAAADAAADAGYTAYAAASAIRAVARAAYAAHAANAAAHAAAYAANAAANAAAYAANAGHTAAYVGSKDIKYYYDYLVKLIANISDLEKELYGM